MDSEDENKDQKELILHIEDEIIAKFCEINGGMEFAMPIIRNQFEKLNIDFKNPTKGQLIQIVDKLIEVTENIKGETEARQEKKIFKDLLAQLENRKEQ